MARAAFALALLLSAAPASAHDAWSDGMPVPDWVKHQCCGEAEVHHLNVTQVMQVEGGWRVDGVPDVIPDKLFLPSPDGDWWIFYRDGRPTGGAFTVRCFFGPMSF